MFTITLPFSGTATAWRRIAGRLMAARVPPEHLEWQIGSTEILPPLPEAKYKVRVPERFLLLAGIAAWHSEAERFDMLYRLAWKLRLQPALVNDDHDPEVARLLEMEQEVLRAHKRLTGRLRLHQITEDRGRRLFAGWCDVAHDPLELALPRYQRQFCDMDWVIFTPSRIADCRGGDLLILPPVERPELPRDPKAEGWQEWLRAQVFPAPFEYREAV